MSTLAHHFRGNRYKPIERNPPLAEFRSRSFALLGTDLGFINHFLGYEWRWQMATSVIIRDESMGGETLGEIIVEFPSERITVNELIRSRIYQEVKESNARAASKKIETPELVQPSPTERTLNGTRSSNPAPVNWQTQFDKAVNAFRANRIMILIDDRQVTSLDEQIEIHSATRISFLRLTMLMGG